MIFDFKCNETGVSCHLKEPKNFCHVSFGLKPVDRLASEVLGPFLSIDFANYLSCTSKTVKIDPKTSLAGRSTGFGPNDTGPKFLGSF